MENRSWDRGVVRISFKGGGMLNLYLKQNEWVWDKVFFSSPAKILN